MKKEKIILSLAKNNNIKIDTIIKNFDKHIYLQQSETKNLYFFDTNNIILNDLKEQEFKCNICKTPITHIQVQLIKKGRNTKFKFLTKRGKITKDHIFPKSLGGKLTPNNKQYLCTKCNSRKSDKVLEPFKKEPLKLTIAITETYFHILKDYYFKLKRYWYIFQYEVGQL
jgi:5-methylcytosine-specific restriction endonuclease McrA